MVRSESEKYASNFICLGLALQRCLCTNSSVSTWGLGNSVGLFLGLKLSFLYLRAAVMPYIWLSDSILNIAHWSYHWKPATKMIPFFFFVMDFLKRHWKPIQSNFQSSDCWCLLCTNELLHLIRSCQDTVSPETWSLIEMKQFCWCNCE